MARNIVLLLDLEEKRERRRAIREIENKYRALLDEDLSEEPHIIAMQREFDQAALVLYALEERLLLVNKRALAEHIGTLTPDKIAAWATAQHLAAQADNADSRLLYGWGINGRYAMPETEVLLELSPPARQRITESLVAHQRHWNQLLDAEPMEDPLDPANASPGTKAHSLFRQADELRTQVRERRAGMETLRRAMRKTMATERRVRAIARYEHLHNGREL